MPISGPSSYVPTCQDFLVHWAEVNAVLAAQTPPAELVLGGALLAQATPLVRGDMAEVYASLLTKRTDVTEALVELDFARSDLRDVKARLALRVAEFIGVIRGTVPDTKYARSLPAQPEPDDTVDSMNDAVVRVKKIWTNLNGSGMVGVVLPLVLQAGYAVGTLGSDLTALGAANLGLKDTAAGVKLLQEARNDIQDVLYPILKAYRQVMPQKFPLGNALIDTLPALTPPPGSTPEPVALTAALDVPTNKARLTWTASGNAALDHYEVRSVPGATYNSDDEVHVATIAKDAARELLTDHFLTDPGQTASFKVFAVLTTGNEAGSNAESVTRPV